MLKTWPAGGEKKYHSYLIDVDAMPSHVRHIQYLFNLQITYHDPVVFNCWIARREQVAVDTTGMMIMMMAVRVG